MTPTDKQGAQIIQRLGTILQEELGYLPDAVLVLEHEGMVRTFGAFGDPARMVRVNDLLRQAVVHADEAVAKGQRKTLWRDRRQ